MQLLFALLCSHNPGPGEIKHNLRGYYYYLLHCTTCMIDSKLIQIRHKIDGNFVLNWVEFDQISLKLSTQYKQTRYILTNIVYNPIYTEMCNNIYL